MKASAICFLAMTALLATCCTAARATLIAQWSFSTGTSADLNSNVGSFTLSQTGNGGSQTTTFNTDGTVTIGGGRELYTTGLNSTVFPTLQSNATIYLRMRFDNTATGANAAIAGFMHGTGQPESSGGYNAHSTMGLVGGSTSTLSFYDLLSDNSAINPGSSLPSVPSGMATLALVFTSDNTTDHHSQGRLYINGTDKTLNGNVTTPLANFDYFALGRILSGTSSNVLTFDDIRIYDEALTDSQIAAIVPEPASLGLLSVPALFCLRASRRRRVSLYPV